MYGHHLASERMRSNLIAANPTDLEVYLFHEGSLHKSYELFGAHVIDEGGRAATRFCVWAPHARDVRLVGFGSFMAVDRKAGVARNPQTGQEIARPASRTARFRPGEGLKSALNG